MLQKFLFYYKMIKCLSSLESKFQSVFLRSAHGPTRIGEYAECIQDESMNYSSATFQSTINQLIAFQMGFCLPKACTATQTKEILTDLINSAQLNYSVVAVDDKIQFYQYPYDWLFFLTVAILTGFTFLSIIFSFIKEDNVFGLNKSIKIFQERPNRLNVFNGVRSFAMIYVVFGHQHFFNLQVASNSLTFSSILQKPYFLIVEAGMFAVDTFFYLGGFMAAYVLLRQKNFNLFTYPLVIFNRLLRIWPSYIVAILIFYSIFMHLGSGPNWHLGLDQVQLCDGMWRSLLFLDNFIYNGTQMCMNWGWYLQNDMQMFVVSGLVLLFYRKSKFATCFLIVLMIGASFAFTMAFNYTHYYKQPIHLEDFGPTDTSFPNLYIKPYSRCPPYLIGVLLGIAYVELLNCQKKQDNENTLIKIKNKFNQSKKYEKGCELLGLVILCFFVFIPRTSQLGLLWNQLVNSLYLTYVKSFYVIGVTCVILPSLLGCNSVVRMIMDNKWTNFISKVSFFTYLIHINVVWQWANSRKVEQYYSLIPLFETFIAHTLITLALATWLTLVIEVPFSKMQKKLMAKLKK